MSPSVPGVLAALAALVRDEAGPALGDSYVGQQLLRGVPLLESIAEEFDRAVAWRVEENTALRTLFASAAPAVARGGAAASRAADPAAADVDDRGLAAALAQAAAGTDADLRVSVLCAGNEGLRALLVRLHRWCECSDAPEARTLEEAVWTELRASTLRRRLVMSRF